MGLDRPEIQAMSLQEFLLREQAHLLNEATAVRRHLMTANTILALFGEDPVDIGDFQEAGRPTDDEKQEYEALKGRYPGFVTDPTQ